ncbi:MAG TPA: HD-GYP domain-containing protein [Phycisphaerales bacterium]|nr:HD-GYP domain-containing protein [Phycisphaerales bacterium]
MPPPETVQLLLREIESKDYVTAAHTWRVVLYTRALAEFFGLDRDAIARLSIAAALHDIGKVETPDAILRKAGPLTPDEFEIIKAHPGAGHARLLALGETDPLVLDLVRHHHERLDGLGYPDGLAGDAIPAPARYFSVVDSFDALTSLRPYRRSIGPEAERNAIRELRDGVGSRYCAECVEAFARLHERGEISWIGEHYNDRCVLPPFVGEGSARSARRAERPA